MWPAAPQQDRRGGAGVQSLPQPSTGLYRPFVHAKPAPIPKHPRGGLHPTLKHRLPGEGGFLRQNTHAKRLRCLPQSVWTPSLLWTLRAASVFNSGPVLSHVTEHVCHEFGIASSLLLFPCLMPSSISYVFFFFIKL